MARSNERTKPHRPLDGTQTEGHPLWPEFKAWAAVHVPADTMLIVWWECFLAGARAATRVAEPSEPPAPETDPAGDLPGAGLDDFDISGD